MSFGDFVRGIPDIEQSIGKEATLTAIQKHCVDSEWHSHEIEIQVTYITEWTY